MPRFHFNVYDGTSSIDNDGVDLKGLEQARLEAVEMAGELIKDQAQRMVHGEDWHIDVTNDIGLILFRIDFLITEAAAALGAR